MTHAPAPTITTPPVAALVGRRDRPFLWLMNCASVAMLFASLALGGVPIALADVLGALANGISDAADAGQSQLIINHIRLPRALAAFAVGAVLALSGAMLQGLFRNPLADPGLVGVSAGAAFAAVATIVFSSLVASLVPASVIRFIVPLGAFAGGFGK